LHGMSIPAPLTIWYGVHSGHINGLRICSRPPSFLSVSELALPFAPSCTYVSFVPELWFSKLLAYQEYAVCRPA